MRKYLALLFASGLIFAPQSIKRDIYTLYVDEFPLVKEYESLLESEESGSLPVTAFEECPGGVCPIK